MPGSAARLRIGDRVRFGGTVRTVIGLSGTLVRLADPAGTVTEVTLAELMTSQGFEHAGARSPARCRRSARWTGCRRRGVTGAVVGTPHRGGSARAAAGRGTGQTPKPEYDPRLVSLTRREQAKAAELTAAGKPVTASAVKQRRRRYQAGGLAAMADRRAAPRTPP